MAAAVVLEVPRRAEVLVEERLLGEGWPDTGCDLAPSCLECPFAKCRYDYFGGLAQLRADERRRQAQEMSASGAHPAVIAEALGVSLRQAQRLVGGK